MNMLEHELNEIYNTHLNEMDEYNLKLIERLNRSYKSPIKKENYKGSLLLSTMISETSGGSCWNEDNHYDSDIAIATIREELAESLTEKLSSFIKELEMDEDLLRKMAMKVANAISRYDNIDQYYIHEYYGNSTTYGVYVIKIRDLLSLYGNEHIIESYDRKLENYR